MKIVFVNSCPYLGGAELWQLRTAAGLRSRGHLVRMLLRPGPLADQARALKLPVETVAMRFDLDAVSLVQSLLYFRQWRPDLALLNDQRECRIIAPAARIAGVRARVQRKGSPFLKGSWRDRMVYRYFITHLVANSEAVAQVFRDRSGLPGNKITVIPNGVALSRFTGLNREAARKRLAAPESEPVIGSAGRLVGLKGFDVLIQAAGILHRKGRRLRVAIAGTGPLADDLRATALVAGLEKRLLLPGQVEDIPGFLAGLDLFVLVSRLEGHSNALTEAMAAGLPVIASDIPANRALVHHEETGLLVPPGNPALLAEAMDRVLADPQFARGLGQAARAWVEANLDEKKILDDLEALLVGLAAGPGPEPSTPSGPRPSP